MPDPRRPQPARPPESYVHGDGHVVIVPARVASILIRQAGLDAWRIAHRGIDPEVDAVLVALTVASHRWRASVGVAEERESAEAEPPSKWVSATQAAELLGITAWAVRLAIREGRLPAEKFGSQWRIAREDIEHWRTIRAG